MRPTEMDGEMTSLAGLAVSRARRSASTSRASPTNKVKSGRVQRSSRVRDISGPRRASPSYDGPPIVLAASLAKDDDEERQHQPVAPQIKIESITNPKVITIYGEEQLNPFFETLPKQPTYINHNPAVLQIIDGPRAEQDLSDQMDKKMGGPKPAKQPFSFSQLINQVLGRVQTKQQSNRPVWYQLPEVTVEEVECVVKIIRGAKA